MANYYDITAEEYYGREAEIEMMIEESNREEAENKIRKEYEQKREEWLRANAFNAEEEVTYVYFPKDSYDIKEDLKEDGFKYNPNLFWHIAEVPAAYAERVLPISLDSVVEFTAWGKGYFKANAKALVQNEIAAREPMVESSSEWVGEIGKRFYDIPVKVVTTVRNMQTKYGYTNMFKFEDKEGNIYQWWTSTIQDFELGDNVLLTGTIKKHDEYKNEKMTVLTRCKIKKY